jgi:hypothetical protein
MPAGPANRPRSTRPRRRRPDRPRSTRPRRRRRDRPRFPDRETPPHPPPILMLRRFAMRSSRWDSIRATRSAPWTRSSQTKAARSSSCSARHSRSLRRERRESVRAQRRPTVDSGTSRWAQIRLCPASGRARARYVRDLAWTKPAVGGRCAPCGPGLASLFDRSLVPPPPLRARPRAGHPRRYRSQRMRWGGDSESGKRGRLRRFAMRSSMEFHSRDAQRALDAIQPDEGRSLVELLRQARTFLTPRTP